MVRIRVVPLTETETLVDGCLSWVCIDESEPRRWKPLHIRPRLLAICTLFKMTRMVEKLSQRPSSLYFEVWLCTVNGYKASTVTKGYRFNNHWYTVKAYNIPSACLTHVSVWLSRKLKLRPNCFTGDFHVSSMGCHQIPSAFSSAPVNFRYEQRHWITWFTPCTVNGCTWFQL